MSNSISRQHLNLALQRAALLNDEAKRQLGKNDDVKKRAFQNEIDKSNQLKKRKRKAIPIQNPHMDSLTQFEGNKIELQRQLKRARTLVDPLQADTKALETEKRKASNRSENLKYLTRFSDDTEASKQSSKKLLEKKANKRKAGDRPAGNQMVYEQEKIPDYHNKL